MTSGEAYELCWHRSMFEEHRWAILHDEIAAQVIRPGCLVEIGVARGGVLGYMALTNPSKNIYGYCRFDGGLLHSQSVDGPNLPDGLLGGGPTQRDVQDWLIGLGAGNVMLVGGDVCETLPKEHEPVSLAVIDLNLYVPTLHALKWCQKHMVPGGVILVDDATFSGVEKALAECGMGWESAGYMARLRR